MSPSQIFLLSIAVAAVSWPGAQAKGALTRTATVWTATGVQHLKFPFRTDKLEHACELMSGHMTVAYDNVRKHCRSNNTCTAWMHIQQWRVANRSVAVACEDMKSWPSVFATTGETVKRQAVAVAAIAGSLFGSYVLPKITSWFSHDAVGDHVEEIAWELERLDRHVGTLQQQYVKSEAQIMDLVATTAAALKFEAEVQRISTALANLVANKRVTPALLSVSDVRDVWEKYKDEVDPSFQLPFEEEAVYEFPAAYELGRDGTMYIYLHCPLLRASYSLYHYRAFPISAGTGAFTLASSNGEMLAVNDEGTGYFLPSWRDVSSCLTIGRVHICQPEVVYQDFSRNCLAAIYAGLKDAVRDRCLRVPVDDPWVVAAGAKAGWFYLYTDRPLPFTVQCDNGTVEGGDWEAGLSSFYCSPSCSISSAGGFTVYQPRESSATISMERNFDVTFFDFDVTTFEDLDREEPVWHHHQWHSPVSLALAGAIALSVGLFVWVCCLYLCRGKNRGAAAIM